MNVGAGCAIRAIEDGGICTMMTVCISYETTELDAAGLQFGRARISFSTTVATEFVYVARIMPVVPHRDTNIFDGERAVFTKFI